jgi:hypothetical protein
VTKEKSEQGYGQEGEEVEVAREATGREETRTFVETQESGLSFVNEEIHFTHEDYQSHTCTKGYLFLQKVLTKDTINFVQCYT